MQASTNWQEQVGADEADRHARYAKLLSIIQKKKSREYGTGRALHRKQLLALEARLDIRPDLPEPARHGLFARPGRYDCLLRYSNGGLDVKSDATPDIRGLAIKVLGVEGPGALGQNTESQDFLCINQDLFSARDSAEFMGVVEASVQGNWNVVKHFVKNYGLWNGLVRMKKAIGMLSRPFSGFATEPFNTVLPFACGPYAARLRVLPASSRKNPQAKSNWAADILDRLKEGPLLHEVQLQFYVSEELTPIEDGSRGWREEDSPYVTVGQLTIPPQSTDAAAADALSERIDRLRFDPWNALAEHRPLGEIMRARKHAYFASQKARGVA